MEIGQSIMNWKSDYRSTQEKPIPNSVYKGIGEKYSQIFDYWGRGNLYIEEIPYTDFIKLHRKIYICEVWKFEIVKIKYYASKKVLER